LSAHQAPVAVSTSAPNAAGVATASHSDCRAPSRAASAVAPPDAYSTATAAIAAATAIHARIGTPRA
jgi:hypothetical protein